MPRAQIGSTEKRSAAWAGRMQSGATTVAPSAAAAATATNLPVLPSTPYRRARRAATTVPATAACAANQPTQTSWAGHWLTAASVEASASWTMPKLNAMPS
ncbi:hypothetical protein PSN01_00611 [Micromonospora saelicesensis]|nr:hypothetical protein PSN01_00611 [Micromonospora saelicesensis]